MTCKNAFELYPFLRPSDRAYTEEELSDEYFVEIPIGWYKLFYQMCSDLTPVLRKYNMLHDFHFLQVKEKFNRLCCYYTEVPKEVEDILDKYEVMAYYICSQCGKPATAETQNYWLSFCDECQKHLVNGDKAVRFNFNPIFTITINENGRLIEKTISFEDEWNRYLLTV